MKRALPLLLLLGALFGLLGEQTVATAAPVPVAAAAPAAAMSADCMEMMGQHPAKQEKKPCNGLTLDCIFAMGCALPLLKDPAKLVGSTPIVSKQDYWSISSALLGHDLTPEPEPPIILG